jgi:peptidoglycan/xylan/chitin deacetylase (PgdA/CDA1 family)
MTWAKDTWPPCPRPKRSALPNIRWPNGARVAFWVAPNIEFYELYPPTNPVRPAWPRPLPDVLNYSWRDYGNRVGVWRCLELFDDYKIVGSVSLNSAMCAHLPEVVGAFNDRGWELFSHGTYNTRYLYGLTPDQEFETIQESCQEIEAFCGKKVRGFLAPALTYNEGTFETLAKLGLSYTLDLFHEDVPLPLHDQYNGMVSVPYQVELNDFHALVASGMAADLYLQRFKDHFDRLYEEGARSGTVVGLPLHPYVIGMPQYAWVLDAILAYVRKHNEVWITTAAEIAEHYVTHVLNRKPIGV